MAALDELEGAALLGGELGEHGHLDVTAGEADLVAGEGPGALEEIVEAAVELVGL